MSRHDQTDDDRLRIPPDRSSMLVPHRVEDEEHRARRTLLWPDTDR